MKLLMCKMCGGGIELSSDKIIGVCDSCGGTTTFQKIDDENKVSLFNRGNALRMRGEFDKAATVFERIIEQDEMDAEAHWCLALCHYGIEYVEDPKSGERIPTCHRTSYNLFLNDIDYMSAIKYSDSYTASLYETEAKRITEIQKGILAISKQEDSFDVFLCYKETTETGSRTKDSIIAQDIYYELTNVGYKVFFSRITLEEKLGTEFEPYIFAALNSAKVMIVIGTSVENFNAVWVKNEWSRFLSSMKTQRSRMLIPCYRDMDPYDLPDELALLQSQDMSKIGFIQELIRGVKKVLESTTIKNTVEKVDVDSAASLGRLIKNSNIYLQLNNYLDAQEVFTRITKEYPEDYRGWWGLILCATKGLKVMCSDLSSLDIWYGYVKQLSMPEAFVPLEAEYVAYGKIVADSMAVAEEIEINEIINSFNANINVYNESKVQIEKAKEQRKIRYRNEIDESNREIVSAKENVVRCKKQLERCGSKKAIVTSTISFIFSAGVGVITEIYALMFIGIIGVIMMGYGIVTKFWSPSSPLMVAYETAITNAQKFLENALWGVKTKENQFNIDIGQSDKEVEKINSEIEQVKKKIKDCKEYLTYEKDKRIDLLFSQKCQSIGVNQQINFEVEQAQKRIINCKDYLADNEARILELGMRNSTKTD
jgi:hypothetical protein